MVREPHVVCCMIVIDNYNVSLKEFMVVSCTAVIVFLECRRRSRGIIEKLWLLRTSSLSSGDVCSAVSVASMYLVSTEANALDLR